MCVRNMCFEPGGLQLISKNAADSYIPSYWFCPVKRIHISVSAAFSCIKKELTGGLEPPTYALRVRRSTN